MTDTLRSRIIAHTDQPDIYDPPTREAMYARILRDAETIKAAEAKRDQYHAIGNAYAGWAYDICEALERLDLNTNDEDHARVLSLMERAEAGIADEVRAAQEKNDG